MWRCASIATSNTISQAHARTVFERALDAGTCSSPRRRREIGRVSLVEALELTLLISRKEPHRHSRVAAPLAAPLPRGAFRDDDRGGVDGRWMPFSPRERWARR